MNKLLLTLLIFSSIGGYSQIHFEDISQTAGIGEKGPNYGVAFGDYNSDGWEDIYVTRIGQPNRLYQNQGNRTFIDVAVDAGVANDGRARMAVWGDINNDGWLDLFLASGKGIKDVLYLNKGDGTFEDISASARMISGGNGLAAMMGDIDNDGLLDIYVARLGSENTLYRNQGNNTFIDVVRSVGATDTRIAMGSIMFDYDNDRDLDIYLVHDGNQANILYENDGKGYFTNVANQAGVAHESFGMGVDVGDVNNDGYLDIYITNLYENTLFINNGDRTFTEISNSAGITDYGMGWGTGFYDVDNDGWQDIYVANTLQYPNIMYQNQGDNTFTGVSENTVLSSSGSGFGLAGADIDHDGLLDLFVANSNDNIGNQLFWNQSHSTGHWLKVELEGKSSNRNGIGSRLIAIYQDQIFIDELNAGSSYAGQNSLMMHLGLGAITQLDSLKVLWPSGTIDVLVNVDTDQILKIKEGSTNRSIEGESVSSSSVFFLTPNPFSDELKVDYQVDYEVDVELKLLDLSGRIILIQEIGAVESGKHTERFSTELLKPGIYICELTLGGEKKYQKVIKR